MRIFTLSLISILFSSVAFFSPGASAQSVLNPADSVRTYDSTARPIQPPSGQIGKWVRTRILDWNTNSYKAYIYKGVAFRLRFPKTYIPAVADGKKYPMMAFFHGLGEASPIYDNEFHLLHGGQFFDENINSGNFDGYVLAMQSTGFFGGNHYQYLTEIIEYMIANNKLDPFAITANGLSAGGQASWEMAINFPTYISGAAPLSWSSIQYTQAAVVDKLKYTRLWVFQGSLDGNPAPSTTYQVRDAIKAAGGHFKLTEYPNVEHWTWDRAWREPDFFPFIKRAYSSNPYPKGGISQFLSGEVINASLGLAPGFAGYQWRKDGVVLTGATQNILLVNQFGTYDARVLRNGIWSEWSRIPVVVQIKDPFVPIPEKIEAEEWTAMSGVQNENTSDAEGGLNVAFVDAADWMDYSVKAPTAGKYSLKLRLASPNTGGEIQIRGTGGSLLATVAVPNTGGYQNWTTVYAIVTLPVGNQTIRITSTAGGWNFNWIEFLQGVVNQPPTSDAGPNVTIYLPQTTVALNGAGADADGFVGSFNWSKIYGPAAGTFTNPLSAQTSVTGLAQATYVFRLTVTDNLGIFSIDDVTVIVNPAVPPASGTRIEAENHTAMNGIQIEGTADLGGGLNVGWIDNNDWMDYSFTAPTAGTYAMRFRIATPLDGAQLQVRNAEGTVLATVNVANTGGWQSWQTVTSSIVLPQGTQTFRIVSTAAPSWNINWMELGSGTTAPSNLPPTANAGSDKTITLPVSSVQLSGSASDADGTVATLRWTKVSGPASGTFSDNTVATTTVSGLTAGTYVYRLTATDNSGAAGFDDVSVIVNPAVTPPPPPPPASTSTHIEAEHYATMSGVLTENTGDVGGGINVGWIDNTDWMDYSFTAPAAGTYAMQFRIATPLDGAQLQVRKADGTVLTTINVINTGGWQSWQTMTSNIVLPQGTQTFRVISTAVPNWNINWMELSYSGTAPSNVPPTANAGSDKTITLPVSSVQLSGSASDADGTVATLRWTKVSGPASGTFSDNTVPTTTVSGLTAGTYVYRLTATDNSGAAGFDDVSVIVNPAVTPPPPPPPASTSTHIEAELYTTMSGVLTENTGDVGGGINVGWIDFGDWMDYTYNAPSAGTYNIMLRIANPNTGSQLQLRKADGSVLSTVSLPNTGSYQGWQTVTTVVTLAAGPQSIRIISTNSGNWNINWLDIVAGGTPPANSAPTVSAGSDKTIALPTSSVYLNGSATDIDGSIVSYAWSKLSGPSQGTIATATAAATNITGLSQGVYIFALRVTDNSGAAATDEVTVTVNSAPTTAPPSGSYTLLPAKMEAENWSNMQGVQTEGTADAGGGFNVGYIDNGDWMDYNVNAPTTGTYTIRFRIASGGRFNILTNGVQIGSAIWENTGGFQTWRIVTTTINLTQGTQTLRILSAGGTPNFNWFEILLPTTPATAYQNSTLYTTEQRVANLSNAAGIRLFPNPVQDRTMVVVNNDHTGEMTARLVGANGAVYKNIRWTKAAKGTQQFSLNIGSLLPGRYLLIIHTKGEKTSIPIIKL